MRSSKFTCEDTDERDLEARYAAAKLSSDDAEAFEEHFFACDRCWSLVQRAVEIRAAQTRAARARPPRSPAWRSNRVSRWLTLAAAAIIVAGIWRAGALRGPGSETVAMRSPTDSLHVVTGTRGATLIASWARAIEASSYRVRLYSASGTLLHQRDLTDTTIAVAASSLPKTLPGTDLYWEIQAINRSRQVVARSGLRAVRFPRPADDA